MRDIVKSEEFFSRPLEYVFLPVSIILLILGIIATIALTSQNRKARKYDVGKEILARTKDFTSKKHIRTFSMVLIAAQSGIMMLGHHLQLYIHRKLNLNFSVLLSQFPWFLFLSFYLGAFTIILISLIRREQILNELIIGQKNETAGQKARALAVLITILLGLLTMTITLCFYFGNMRVLNLTHSVPLAAVCLFIPAAFLYGSGILHPQIRSENMLIVCAKEQIQNKTQEGQSKASKMQIAVQCVCIVLFVWSFASIIIAWVFQDTRILYTIATVVLLLLLYIFVKLNHRSEYKKLLIKEVAEQRK